MSFQVNSAIHTLPLSRQSSVPASPQNKLEPLVTHEDLAPASPVDSPKKQLTNPAQNKKMADLTLYVNYMIKKTDQQEQLIQAHTEQKQKLEAKHKKELFELTKAKSNLEK